MDEARQQRYIGASMALAAVYNSLTEIQAITLRELFPEGSRDISVASDIIEAVKDITGTYYSALIKQMKEDENGGPEG